MRPVRTRFRFRISSDTAPVPTAAAVRFADDLTRVRTRAEGQWYYITTLRGTLKLVGADYARVLDAPLDRHFTLHLEEHDPVAGYTELLRAEFTRLDCAVDISDRYISVTPVVRDAQNKLLDALDTDHNLLGLGLTPAPIHYLRYDALQVYPAGGDTVVTITPGSYTTRTVERQRAGGQWVSDLHWSPDPQHITYVPYVAGQDVDVSGLYTRTGGGPLATHEYTRTDGAFVIDWDDDNFDPNSPNTSQTDPHYRIRDAGGTLIYRTATAGNTGADFYGGSVRNEFYAAADPAQRIGVYTMIAYTRVLTDKAEFQGAPTYAVDSADQWAFGLSYTRVAPYTDDTVIASVVTAPVDRGEGRFSVDTFGTHAGGFIDVPGGFYGRAVPVGRSQWDAVGWFVFIDFGIHSVLTDAPEEIRLADAYRLSDVTAALAREADAALTYVPDTAHSNLLHNATDPLTGAPRPTYFLSPISNVLTRNYDEADDREPISLKNLFDLFAFAFNAFHFTESDRLRIEHLSYFEQARSYAALPAPGIDLTAARDPFTNLPVTTDQHRYTYDKTAVPARIKTAWANEVGPAFRGSDIVVLSPAVDAGRTEERRIARFTTDLNAVLTAPDGFSKDGFLLFACREEEGEWRVVRTQVLDYGELQNGALSLAHLHDAYHRHGLPAARVRLNGSETQALSTRRLRRQTITAPVIAGFDPLLPVRTQIGDGLVRAIEENLSTQRAKIDLDHA